MVTDKFALNQTIWCFTRRAETQRHISCACHIVSIQLPLNWKLSTHWHSLCFHPQQQEAWLSGCYQGTKVKPFGCIVIVQQVYLPMLHHYSVFTCTAHCQEKGLSFENRSAESIASFSHIVNHKASDRDLLLHSPPPLSNSWQTWTVGLVAYSQSCLPHSVRWAKPWVNF